jgi:putative DNA-invertase from lambdoid prophage Rac
MEEDVDRLRHCALWARVSTDDQTTETQLAELRDWAGRRGLAVAAEYEVEDSAWHRRSSRGRDFDKDRGRLVDGARRGDYDVVLCREMIRLSRRGYADLSGVLGQLRGHGCEVWSWQEEWLSTAGPIGEVVVHILAWVGEQDSARKSENVRQAMRRPAVQANMATRRPRGKDKRRRLTDGYAAAWTPERREQLAERNRARAGNGAS